MRVTRQKRGAIHVNNWIRDGLEGRKLRAIARVYLAGILFAAPIALMLALLFDAPTAFKLTPLLVGIGGTLQYAHAHGMHRYAAVEFNTGPTPWLGMLADPTVNENAIEPGWSTAIDLANRGAKLGYRLGRWAEALDLYNRALSINPTIVEAWSNKAVSLWQLGNVAEALACMNKALVIDPDLAEVWFNRALASLKLGLREKAVGFFRRALEIKPELSESILLEGSNYENALMNYEQALMIEGSPAEMWLRKGQLLCNIGRYREGMECFELASAMGDSQAEEEIVRCLDVIRSV